MAWWTLAQSCCAEGWAIPGSGVSSFVCLAANSAVLRGEFAVTCDDRVDLEFKTLVLKVGPFQAAEKVCGAAAVLRCCPSICIWLA